MLGTVKDVSLRLPPLHGAFGIPDRPCAPCMLDRVGAESAPTFDQTPPAGRTESGLTGSAGDQPSLIRFPFDASGGALPL